MTEKQENNLFTDDELLLISIVYWYGLQAIDNSYSFYEDAWFTRENVEAINKKFTIIERNIWDKRSYERDLKER